MIDGIRKLLAEYEEIETQAEAIKKNLDHYQELMSALVDKRSAMRLNIANYLGAGTDECRLVVGDFLYRIRKHPKGDSAWLEKEKVVVVT